jgi:hypothetical protein
LSIEETRCFVNLRAQRRIRPIHIIALSIRRLAYHADARTQPLSESHNPDIGAALSMKAGLLGNPGYEMGMDLEFGFQTQPFSPKYRRCQQLYDIRLPYL